MHSLLLLPFQTVFFNVPGHLLISDDDFNQRIHQIPGHHSLLLSVISDSDLPQKPEIPVTMHSLLLCVFSDGDLPHAHQVSRNDAAGDQGQARSHTGRRQRPLGRGEASYPPFAAILSQRLQYHRHQVYVGGQQEQYSLQCLLLAATAGAS